MQEKQFREYLIDDPSIKSKSNAIYTRMSQARIIEFEFKQSLDEIVQDDMQMYRVLIAIKKNMKDDRGNYTNALRKYYIFKNGREFSRIIDFEKKHGLSPYYL